MNEWTNECWMNCPEHLLCARLCTNALDFRVCALQHFCGGGRWRYHVKTLERSRKGRRDDCKDLALVSVRVLGELESPLLYLPLPCRQSLLLPGPLLLAREFPEWGDPGGRSGLRYLWHPAVPWGLRLTTLLQHCSMGPHGDHPDGEGASLPDTNWWVSLEEKRRVEVGWALSSPLPFLLECV